MTLQDLKDNNLILLECISGSKAYGLDIATSDTDYKGVFILPEHSFLGLDYIPQVSDENNDIVFYELKRFIELLYLNNPNILELLNTPADKVIYKHPLMDLIQAEDFLSKKCKDTFAGYAQTQIKKARGLNKKISNPIDKEKKSILDFCYIIQGQGSISLHQWLKKNNISQEECGLINIPHMRDIYALFYHPNKLNIYNGIIKNEFSLDVQLSSIPKEENPIATLSFNKDGYIKYCKDYKNYWSWVEKRNEARYENTVSHGKNYDSKNMMHTFRLLDMAVEILRDHSVNVHRKNRAELLDIRNGEFEYDELLIKAEEKIKIINQIYSSCTLPEKPKKEKAEKVLIEIRKRWYDLNK